MLYEKLEDVSFNESDVMGERDSVECRYTLLRLYSQKTPHISPLRVSYGLSFVRIWVKTDRVITAPHYIARFEFKKNIGRISFAIVYGVFHYTRQAPQMGFCVVVISRIVMRFWLIINLYYSSNLC